MTGMKRPECDEPGGLEVAEEIVRRVEAD